MKYIFYFYSLLLSLSLTAVEFKVHNALKEPVTLSFGAEDGRSLLGQEFTVAPGKSLIKPKLSKDFIISDIYIKSGKPFQFGHIPFSGYHLDENKRNKNLLIKLKLGTTTKLTATGPIKAEGPVIDAVQVIK